MNFKLTKSKLESLYSFFIAPPKRWGWLKRCDVLVYDAASLEALAPYLKTYSVSVIPLRREYVNVPCLLCAILRPSFWRGSPIQAYVDSFIRAVSPRVVITCIDNDRNFYSISNRFPVVKTVFVQNGTRGEVGDVFGYLVRSNKYHVDFMLVHGSAIAEYYKKFISGESVSVGSIKSNHVIESGNVQDGTVLFVSQLCDKPENDAPLLILGDGKPVFWDEIFQAEMRVLPFLDKWCFSNNKKLRICGRGRKGEACSTREKLFYENFLKLCSWEFLPRSNSYSSYGLVDAAELVVFIDSTLGYESIGRGKKTAGFSCRGASLNNEATKFGWPAGLPENGPFWTNDADERQFQRVMDYLNTVGADEWERNRQIYAKELMEFDAGNSRFIALLDQLLPKSEKHSHAQ